MMTGEPGPKWASWSYKKAHLSGRFHSSIDGFDNFVKWLKSNPFCNDAMEIYPQSRSLAVCLGMGMLLRDLHIMQFELGEGGQDAGAGTLDLGIAHLQNSKLTWGHSKQLLRMCTTIVEVLKTCLNDMEKGETASVSYGYEGKQPPSKRLKTQPDRYD